MRIAKIHSSLETFKGTGVDIDNIIDVGIQHSTPVLMDVFGDVHHYLFEPIREYFPFISQNYKNISHDLIEAAVSDVDGELIIHTEKKTRGNEISHSYIVEESTPSSRTVPSLRLDSYVDKIKSNGPYLLKIDVEGPDVPARILKGARNVLKETSVVVIEMTVDTFMERAILLQEAGFDVWDICDLCYYGDCLWQADVIFVDKKIKQSNAALSPIHKKPFRPELWQSGF